MEYKIKPCIKNVLVTGAGGFIGYHLCSRIIQEDINLIGFDNLNDYYDLRIKKSRLIELNKKGNKKDNWSFIEGDLENNNLLKKIFREYNPDVVIHLAAQAGVRYSITNPAAYINSNLIGFANVLECCRQKEVKNFIYASSSSVYGGNTKVPFHENDNVNHPISLYAATKKSNELMAHAYSHLYNLPCTGLRFFTVYGPWGRPDMAPMIFTDAIINNKELKIFNNGNNSRDFTYIDDVINVIAELINIPAMPNENFDKKSPEQSTSWAPFRLFNVGGNKSISVLKFIDLIEKELGIKANKIMYPMQPGDVVETYADTSSLEEILKNKRQTNLKDGIRKFITWYKEFYDINL